MKKIVLFTGAGVSADSGISTFRDSDGLWAKYRIEDICTPDALKHNRDTVIEFYNIRRKELLNTLPNDGHYSIVKLCDKYDVDVITQNIDDLHERAAEEMGKEMKITHLHGELRKLCSSINPCDTISIDGWEQHIESRHSDGSLLRPFVVFFGESVPMFDKALEIVKEADILIIVGTSLAVYPAASLVKYTSRGCEVYLVDPKSPDLSEISKKIEHIKENSIIGLPKLVTTLIDKVL